MPRQSVRQNALSTRQAKSWCCVNFFGLHRSAQAGNARRATSSAICGTVHGDVRSDSSCIVERRTRKRRGMNCGYRQLYILTDESGLRR